VTPSFSIVPKESIFYGPGCNQAAGYTRLPACLTHTFTPTLNWEIAGMLQSTFRHDRISPRVGSGYDERTGYLGTPIRAPYANSSDGTLQPIRSREANRGHANCCSPANLHSGPQVGSVNPRRDILRRPAHLI